MVRVTCSRNIPCWELGPEGPDPDPPGSCQGLDHQKATECRPVGREVRSRRSILMGLGATGE